MGLARTLIVPMRRLLLLVLLALPLWAESRITLLHISDYHSHALPFFTDAGERGGIARVVAYLKREKRKGAVVFNGGDTVNKGAPAWSDRYRCVEWGWLNGIVDAMAFGNHELDYGAAELERCRKSVRYPILGANVPGLARYTVLESQGLLIGVFAVAGSDFQQLVSVPGFMIGDPVEAARDVVHELRVEQGVDVVVMIGHQHAEADYELARSVPGIDVIFGTHSHIKRELTLIPGTSTWFISAYQYLSHVSRVELTFAGRRLTGVSGRLVPVDARIRPDRAVARRVRSMQRALENDPEYRELFEPIATLRSPLLVEPLASLTLDVMREAAAADVAMSTVSSFRRPLPSGVLTMEGLRGALPYDNEIVVCTMSGVQLQRVIDSSEARKGSDSESFVSGADRIDPSRSYRVAATDYQARVAYRDEFDCEIEATGLRVREEVRKKLVEDSR